MTDHHSTSSRLVDVVDVRTILSHWRTILCATGVAVALGAAYLTVAERIYEAEVRVVVQNLGLGLDGKGATKTYDKEFLSTQAEVIRSPLTIGRALELVPPATPPEPDDDPVEDVLDELRVIPLAATDIVRVTFRHNDPQQATRRLESILASYQEHLRDVEQTTASESVELVARRESELSEQLDNMQTQLAAVRAGYSLGGAGTDVRQREDAVLRDLTDQWAAARARRIQLESVADSAESERGVSVPEAAVDSSLYREMLQVSGELREARAALEESKRILGPKHRERIALEQRIASLEQELESVREQVRIDAGRQLAAVRSQEQALQTLIAEERTRLQELETGLLEEQQLLTEIERVGELHASTLATRESLELADRALARGRASVFVQVLDDYVVPQEPIWPLPGPLLVVCGALGMLLSLTWVVIRETDLLSSLRWPLESAPHESSADDAPELDILRDARALHRTVMNGTDAPGSTTAVTGAHS
ncbi:Chain length determinant protein [Maioricimonas rarisocia]|uniref:Chain length determinant protein n=1 Tax=Maioricimonas rarisocia TaxID=2528026 RepID=A0A517ZC91_9PLAN|nr:Wzz/FepE/Etk N-terminal domain-containing protein [Maioricimonas rarisocia]QDU40124.1 Chain length determinant protein [Maioricimonas rarisocia]